MRSFGETPGKREALLNKLVKISETPVKREETPEKGEEPRKAASGVPVPQLLGVRILFFDMAAGKCDLMIDQPFFCLFAGAAGRIFQK